LKFFRIYQELVSFPNLGFRKGSLQRKRLGVVATDLSVSRWRKIGFVVLFKYNSKLKYQKPMAHQSSCNNTKPDGGARKGRSISRSFTHK